eukprot:764987-Hanusia_phi.AAC.4
MQLQRLCQCAYHTQSAHRNEIRKTLGQWMNQQHRSYAQWGISRTSPRGYNQDARLRRYQLVHPPVLNIWTAAKSALAPHQDISCRRWVGMSTSPTPKAVGQPGMTPEELRTWSPDLQPMILQALIELGFDQPTEIQALSLPTTLQGKSTLILAETGTGKTLSFLLPGDLLSGWNFLMFHDNIWR